MAAGYSGQLVALDSLTPAEQQLSTAQANEASTRANIMQQTAPAQIQQENVKAQTAQLQLQDDLALRTMRNQMWQNFQSSQQQQQSPLAANTTTMDTTPLFDPRIEQVMDTIDPSAPGAADKWDQQMTQLANDGVPQASQFVGNLSAANLNHWKSQMGAHAIASPLASAGALAAKALSPLAPQQQQQEQGAPAGAVISPITGKVDPTLTEMSFKFPEQAQKYQAMEGMMMYQRSGNPEYLRRWAPDVYEKLASAANSMSEAQSRNVTTRAQFVGQKANSVLGIADMVKQAGGDPSSDPKVRAAYDTAVKEIAAQGYMSPQEAQRRLTSPIDFADLAEKRIEAQTVTAYFEQDPAHKAAIAGAEAAAKLPFETTRY